MDTWSVCLSLRTREKNKMWKNYVFFFLNVWALIDHMLTITIGNDGASDTLQATRKWYLSLTLIVFSTFRLVHFVFFFSIFNTHWYVLLMRSENWRLAHLLTHSQTHKKNIEEISPMGNFLCCSMYMNNMCMIYFHIFLEIMSSL